MLLLPHFADGKTETQSRWARGRDAHAAGHRAALPRPLACGPRLGPGSRWDFLACRNPKPGVLLPSARSSHLHPSCTLLRGDANIWYLPKERWGTAPFSAVLEPGVAEFHEKQTSLAYTLLFFKA